MLQMAHKKRGRTQSDRLDQGHRRPLVHSLRGRGDASNASVPQQGAEQNTLAQLLCTRLWQSVARPTASVDRTCCYRRGVRRLTPNRDPSPHHVARAVPRCSSRTRTHPNNPIITNIGVEEGVALRDQLHARREKSRMSSSLANTHT